MAKLYSPYQISKMTDAEIRKAYSSLRSVANKRLGRLQAQGLNMTARTGYRFPTISQVQESSKATVASELADVSKWLREERSTVKGEKAFLSYFQELMNEKGYGDFVDTPDKIYETLEFLDDVREQYKDQLKGSDILDVLEETDRLNIPREKVKENIDLFIANIEKLKDVKPTKGGQTFSSRRINSLIKKWDRK